MEQYNEFIKVLKALEEYDVDYILIGGFAVFLHGLSRFTRDIDIFIKMLPHNIEKLQEALISIFDDESIKEITIDELDTYQVIRYASTKGFYIDILAQLGDFASYKDLDYEILEYEGSKIKIATPETLYKLKKDTVRPQDKQDSMFLAELIREKKDK